MPDNVTALSDFIDVVRTDVINSMQAKGRHASGNTAKELTIVTSDEYAALLAPEYIDALEYGRKPTRPGAPASDPTLFERIKQWISDKGLDLNPYAVTKKIHKYGYAGKPGVLTEPLSDDNVSKRLENAMLSIADNEADLVLDLFNIF